MTVTSLAARQEQATRAGIPIALASAAAFGLSGPLAKSLLEAGWTPASVVAVRASGAFLLLAIPCLVICLREGFPTLRQTRRLFVYGVVAIAGAQLCYFSAVQYLSVGVALLLEYSAPVLLIGWQWWRTKTPPTRAVLLGAGVAVAGMILVLDLFSGFKLHPIGVLYGLGAAVCLAAYFVLSDDTNPSVTSSPLLMTTVGTGVGAGVLLVTGSIGLLPLAATTNPTTLGGLETPWWFPVLLIVGVCAIFAYLSGIVAVRRLGSSLASFVSLTEIIFAVVFAIILLGQQPSVGQVIGGALVLTGIAVIQRAPRASR